MPDKQDRHVSVIASGVYPTGQPFFVIASPQEADEAISIGVMRSNVLKLIPEQMLRATRKYEIAASSPEAYGSADTSA